MRLGVYDVVGRSEYAGRGRQAHYGSLVGMSPCELDGVKFLVAVVQVQSVMRTGASTSGSTELKLMGGSPSS